MEEPSQEIMFKLQMFDQQIKQIQQQLGAIEQGIAEMITLDAGLDELVGKKGQEIFAPIGRGIFVKARLESENLNVDVGGGNIVQKNIPDTKEIIADQIQKLKEVQKELESNLEQIGGEFNKMIMEAQAGEKQEHVHGPECHHDSEKEVEKKKDKKIDELV
jgi:prefoldin alpha subunit